MNSVALYAVLSVVAVSLISMAGLFVLAFISNPGRRLLSFLISFSVGALLGDVFIHLLPEMAEQNRFNLNTSLIILAAILAFFIIEKYVHWHHHYTVGKSNTHTHPVVWTNLIGDGLHNLIDGMVIAGAYLLDVRVGLATTVAVILHEIPQEIGDFGILLHAGLSKRQALFYNFLSALASLAGAILVLIFGTSEYALTVLAALGVGSFIYIAIADLIPEIHKEKEQTLIQLLSIGLGIAIMLALLLLK